jgi:hypothetical protein
LMQAAPESRLDSGLVAFRVARPLEGRESRSSG